MPWMRRADEKAGHQSEKKPPVAPPAGAVPIIGFGLEARVKDCPYQQPIVRLLAIRHRGSSLNSALA
ncbi:hypothetical protein EMIT051CA3_60113 [Pseudomonas chlororaphis]